MIYIDLKDDWKTIIKQDIHDMIPNLDFKIFRDEYQLFIRYFNVLRRTQSNVIHEVKFSKEFYCPSKYKHVLTHIVNLLENGRCIKQHMSDKILNLQVDPMFNDWGILHLHLSLDANRKYPNKEFLRRTGPLLFLILDKGIAYIINIYNHGDWTRNDILQTVYSNWAHLLHVLDDVTIKDISEKDRYHMRMDGGYVIDVVNDNSGKRICVVSKLGFIVSSRDSMLDVRSVDHIYSNLEEIEQRYILNLEKVKMVIEQSNKSVPISLRVKLIRINGRWFTFETNSRTLIELVPNIGSRFIYPILYSYSTGFIYVAGGSDYTNYWFKTKKPVFFSDEDYKLFYR